MKSASPPTSPDAALVFGIFEAEARVGVEFDTGAVGQRALAALTRCHRDGLELGYGPQQDNHHGDAAAAAKAML
jgi:hypothetical protein